MLEKPIINKGKEFSERIDLMLKLENHTRKELCDYAGISVQAFSNWKLQSSLPGAETALKIADFLNVSLEWLINGYIKWNGWTEARPSQVYNRIANILKEQHKDPYNISDEELHAPLTSKGIVNNITLLNWKEERTIPNSYDLYRVAKELKQTYIFISTGVSGTQDESLIINGEKISNEEYIELYQLKKHKKLLEKFESLFEEDKTIIINLINRMFSFRYNTKKDES